eukprot:scaffold3926_cov124-Isochrysis_galbana.AAC.2
MRTVSELAAEAIPAYAIGPTGAQLSLSRCRFVSRCARQTVSLTGEPGRCPLPGGKLMEAFGGPGAHLEYLWRGDGGHERLWLMDLIAGPLGSRRKGRADSG